MSVYVYMWSGTQCLDNFLISKYCMPVCVQNKCVPIGLMHVFDAYMYSE